ncbi:tRNA (adenine(58)-N(1))-methyltransferase, mitochondrial isoform X2 [Pristis pectinata]|uniref:tRNA (adenine(58)-N(1))-methyltransferase, mitochondrial isoform X2 n=1 Tax=Pristis pectinata TaxID=685728 RepID=UPI00223E472C|nr:tRNA (adenine(58)-N(1))-methyltransferase, mitochondrial isoform X2 [Pristis pectinata]
MRRLQRSCCIVQTTCWPAKDSRLRCGVPAGGRCCRRPVPGFSKGSVRPGSSGSGTQGGDDSEGDRSAGVRESGAGQTWPLARSPWSWRSGLPPRRLSLSPLERVSDLIPEQMLSREVLDLSSSVTTAAPELLVPPSTAKEVPLKIGDLVLAEFRKRHRLDLQKMFLLVAGGELHSKWGMLTHQEILGHLPGQVFRTSTGSEFVLRRPTLEEFVLLMRRGPAISYPKDATTMLMMMDVGNGDCVLESGSGSGAMTLFLSRAVGSSGHVYSFEVRKDHHNTAKRNYQCWRNAYEVAWEKEWPNNVDFINKDIVFATDDIQGKMFDAIALDMLNPQLALPVISTHLKQGGVCAVYLANITQVIDLLEGIRSSCLSFSCEKILEVIHRDWFVAPAVRKDGSTAARVEPQRKGNDLEHEEGKDTVKLEGDGWFG